MDKPKVVNGFSILEVLVIMLIICVFTFQFSTMLVSPSLPIFMEKMMQLSTMAQEKAFIEKEKKEVEIHENWAKFDDTILSYPSQISCSSTSFHYNAKGNINKGGSITCQENGTEKKLIFQIGSGRVRLE